MNHVIVHLVMVIVMVIGYDSGFKEYLRLVVASVLSSCALNDGGTKSNNRETTIARAVSLVRIINIDFDFNVHHCNVANVYDTENKEIFDKNTILLFCLFVVIENN